MPEIKFDTGLVTYDLNGKCEVTFNPGDQNFAERFYRSFENLGSLDDEYSKKISSGTSADAFALAKERDGKMRQVIDDLFGANVCDATIGGMSVCAYASDGFPIWLNLMLAIMDLILDNMDDMEKKIDPRVAKYTAKYKKYAAKHRR